VLGASVPALAASISAVVSENGAQSLDEETKEKVQSCDGNVWI
jgi:hypothetical protein